jgi:hypothetical protein
MSILIRVETFGFWFVQIKVLSIFKLQKKLTTFHEESYHTNIIIDTIMAVMKAVYIFGTSYFWLKKCPSICM